MITEHICRGSKSTSYHNFEFSLSGMDIVLSAGSYWNRGEEKVADPDGAIVTIESPVEDTHYQLWLNDGGLVILSRTDSQEFGEVTNPIDRIAWFTVPAGAATLDDVEVNVLKMTEVDANASE